MKQRFIWNSEYLNFVRTFWTCGSAIYSYELEMRRVLYHLAKMNSTSVIFSLVAKLAIFIGDLFNSVLPTVVVRPLDH